MAGVLKTKALGASLVGVGGARRVLHGLERLLEGVALHALSDSQLSALTTFCYAHGPTDRRTDLFDWEQRWFEADLPKAPATVLIGGAGHGRELRHLTRRGYTCLAFDPAPSAQDGDVLRGCYEDLISDAPNPLKRAVLKAAPYDAVLLGWGSLTHVPSAAARTLLLQTLGSMCSGPILASFWMAVPGGEGRAHALGAKLGQALSSHARTVSPGDRVRTHCGFAHVFTEDELCTWAAAGGRDLTLHRDGYTHATLRTR